MQDKGRHPLPPNARSDSVGIQHKALLPCFQVAMQKVSLSY
jgi:hypothetical protein